MGSPTDRKYLPSHEWAKVDGGLVVIGLSKFAVDELTDITYVELPAVGKQITAGQSFGQIESVKATSDLYAPVSGKVEAVNTKLATEPGAINADPWTDGWMIAVTPSNPGDLDRLLDSAAYDKQTEE